MAKREKKDLFGEMRKSMGEKPTNSLQQADAAPTESLQHADNGPMKDYRVRLPESWWKALTERAAAQGLKPSQLLRQILAEWLST